MTYFNPITGSVLQSTNVQRAQAADKDRQARLTTQQTKNVAAVKADEFAPTVESTDALSGVHDEQPKQQQGRRKPQQPRATADDGEDAPPHVDLKA